MKKRFCLCILLSLFLLAACSGNTNEGEALTALIQDQAQEIGRLEQVIAAQEISQQEQLDLIAYLQGQVAKEDEPVRFWHDYSEAEIRALFFQDGEHLLRQAVGEVREDRGPLQDEDVALIITDRFVYAIVSAEGINPTLVILTYWRDVGADDYPPETLWAVTGYGVPRFLDPLAEPGVATAYIIAPREPVVPRQLTDLTSVTLPFWPWSGAWDDPDPIEETIAGEALWAETIRLVYVHYGVQVRDIWYEDSTLYVELMPIMAGSFNIGLGSIMHGDSLRQTFEAFPGAQDVRFLVLGRRFTAGYNGYDINSLCGGWAARSFGYEDGIEPCTCIW